MTHNWTPQQCRLIRILLLTVVLVLALLSVALARRDFYYPIHSDEWSHYADVQSLMNAGRLPYANPNEAGTMFAPDTEIGFHLLLGEVKYVTGLPWLAIFRWLPGIILAVLAFVIYALARRKWYGLLAAFFAVLIPTTVRLLGPAFLVPVAMGLIYIPLTLLVLHRWMNNWRGPVILILLLLVLLFIHPPSFIIVSGIAIVHTVFGLFPGREYTGPRLPAVLALAGIVAIYIFGYLWGSSYVSFNITQALIPESEQQLPPVTDVVAKFGYVPPLLFAAGIGILTFRGKRCGWALAISALGLLAFLIFYFYTLKGPDIIYERGWLYLYVLMAIIGGMALGKLGQWLYRVFQAKQKNAVLAAGGAVTILLALSLGLALRSHLDEQYYRLVNDTSYQEFSWVKENVSPDYRTAVTDIGIASPFAAVSGKYVYIGEVSRFSLQKEPEVIAFYKEKAADTAWLERNGINMVYSNGEVDNVSLDKISRGLYLLNRSSEELK